MVVVEEDQKWQVHYSRFFNFPETQSGPHPVPCGRRKTNPKGNWVSSSALASLSLSPALLSGGPALSLHLGPTRKLEEHYISKLVFSWPQTSCGDQCRGSRVVFVSYRDGLGEVQKFTVRFLTAAESQRFISCLRVFFKDILGTRLARSKNQLDGPTSLDFIQSNDINSMNVVELSNQNPVRNIVGATYTDVKEATSPTLPTSFTSMLSDSCTEQQNVALFHSLHDDKSTVQKPIYCEVPNVGDMTTSSFFEMLSKLEEIIAQDGSTL